MTLYPQPLNKPTSTDPPKSAQKRRARLALTLSQYLCISAVSVFFGPSANFGAKAQEVNLDALEETLGVSIEVESTPDQSYAEIAVVDLSLDLEAEVESMEVEAEPLPTLAPLVTVSEAIPTNSLAENEANAQSLEDWFYVGMIDYTLSRSSRSSAIQHQGEAGFYVNGQWGTYEVTSSARTEFDGDDFTAPWRPYKDNQNVISRIAAQNPYSVYGDGSQIVDHAPSNGNFYFSMASEYEQFLWGNYKAGFVQGDLLKDPRTLYGASLTARSEGETAWGEPEISANLYAALPDSVSTKDVLRGTGGAVYFLNHPDLIAGSETVVIETRDRLSDRIISRETLIEGQDYALDAFRGTLILNTPLSSVHSSTGTLDDDVEKQLAVYYQYVPTYQNLDYFSTGASSAFWLGDTVRFATSVNQTPGEFGQEDYQSYGAELTARFSDISSLTAEYAESQGVFSQSSRSQNGGISFDTTAAPSRAQRGEAYRFEAHLSLDDLIAKDAKNGVSGAIGGYYEAQSAGFSNAEKTYDAAETALGVYADFSPSPAHRIHLSYEEFQRENALKKQDTEIELGWKATPDLSWSLSATHSAVDQFQNDGSQDEGARAHVALRFDHKLREDFTYYGFVQNTFLKDEGRAPADRLGFGAHYQINETKSASGEASIGSEGVQGRFRYEIETDPQTQTYFGYEMSAPIQSETALRTNLANSGFVFGQRQRHSDKISSYHETTINPVGASPFMNAAIGLDYAITQNIHLNAEYEIGEIFQKDAPEIDRRAASIGAQFTHGDDTQIGFYFEHRQDQTQSDQSSEETTILKAELTHELNPNLQMQGGVEALKSDTDERNFYNRDYLRADLGLAYRPIHNDRLNALMQYSYVDEQSSSASAQASLGQNAHVFSIDAIYELNSWLSLGGKYALRVGEMEQLPQSDTRLDTMAQLAIARAEIRPYESYEILAEYRTLSSDSAAFSEDGVLVGLFKDLNTNIKIGAGYNFTHFSDDLTDLNRDHEGVFVNILAKF